MNRSLRIGQAVACLAMFLFGFYASAQVLLNEICADNQTAFNNDGDFPDYVELYNTNTVAVNIATWKLSIDAAQLTNPNKTYIFPANTVVPARGYMLVICDG